MGRSTRLQVPAPRLSPVPRTRQTRVSLADANWEGAKAAEEFTHPCILRFPSSLSEGCKERVQKRKRRKMPPVGAHYRFVLGLYVCNCASFQEPLAM